ncbi:MAG: ABC transporter ATP-binding protein [Calditrichaeota bacterium]|nr:MAG: ABC transporter ATP-binding protein [Calditrichota bacterium]
MSMNNFLSIQNLTFAYPLTTEPLFESVSFQLGPGWTGIVGANGSGKTTLLKLLCGILQPDSGSMTPSLISYYCEQRTETPPQQTSEFITSYDKSGYNIKEQLQIEDNWFDRWESLSHGERKRCQIGTALFLAPDLLALDEPTNHLDSRSRRILVNALGQYRGIGRLVSHD